MIAMVDLKAEYQQLKKEIDESVLKVLADTQYILGPNVQAFEKEAATYLGVKHAIGVATGTDALYLALMAHDIQPGDEIITTPFSFIAACEAICYLKAKPVFVDIDPSTFCIDNNKIEAAITPKTKAIIPVHLYGLALDIAPLLDICKRHNLKLIEDCAQSFGATYKGKQTGVFGDVGCFSFYPSKTLGCFGDGGMVTTNCDHTAERIKQLRNHGCKVRYEHLTIGLNSRLDEIQAAILRVKLRYLDKFNQSRQQIARHYSEMLTDINVTTPATEFAERTHVYHQFTILSKQRDAIAKALADNDIASAIHYPKTIHKQPVFAEQYKSCQFPHAEAAAQHCLSLPIFPTMTMDQVNQVVKVIKGVVGVR